MRESRSPIQRAFLRPLYIYCERYGLCLFVYLSYISVHHIVYGVLFLAVSERVGALMYVKGKAFWSSMPVSEKDPNENSSIILCQLCDLGQTIVAPTGEHEGNNRNKHLLSTLQCVPVEQPQNVSLSQIIIPCNLIVLLLVMSITQHLLCVSHCSKCFIHIYSFKLYRKQFTSIIPISWTRKPRPREVKYLHLDHTASN